MKYSSVPYPFCRECGIYFTYLWNWKRICAYYSHTCISTRGTYTHVHALSIYIRICIRTFYIPFYGIKMKVEFVFQRKYPFKSKRCVSLMLPSSPDFTTFVLFKRCNEYKLIINLNWNTVDASHLLVNRRNRFALITFFLHFYSFRIAFLSIFHQYCFVFVRYEFQPGIYIASNFFLSRMNRLCEIFYLQKFVVKLWLKKIQKFICSINEICIFYLVSDRF